MKQLLFIFIAFMALRFFSSLWRRLAKGLEVIQEKYRQQQEKASEIPESIRRLFDIQDNRPLAERAKLSEERPASTKTHNKSYTPIKKRSTSHNLEIVKLSEEEPGGSIFDSLDLAEELKRGVIMKEILDRKF
ncbi:MAG: hypothetical protein Q4D93_05745 [Porphyromonas sp.]|nr:hypothetical protein [Porphyromonas sp.]